MPRFVVERTFPDGLVIPVNELGAHTCLNVIGQNLQAVLDPYFYGS